MEHIGWENDRGAYFINKLSEEVENLNSKISKNTEDISNISEAVKPNIIDISTNTTNFEITLNNSHYITDKVIHIQCRAIVKTPPSSTSTAFINLPDGLEFARQGLVFPLYKSSGEWSASSSIVYCYQASTSFAVNGTELTTGSYLTLDYIAVIK